MSELSGKPLLEYKLEYLFSRRSLVRRDGMGIIDSRVTIHADDGAVVCTYYTGVTDFGEDAFARLEKGELPEPALRT